MGLRLLCIQIPNWGIYTPSVTVGKEYDAPGDWGVGYDDFYVRDDHGNIQWFIANTVYDVFDVLGEFND